MAKFNITKETVNKVCWGVLGGTTIYLVWKTLAAKAGYYKQASKTVEKTNNMIDKYEKFLDKELND